MSTNTDVGTKFIVLARGSGFDRITRSFDTYGAGGDVNRVHKIQNETTDCP